MNIEHKSFSAEVKAADPEKGLIEAIVSVFSNRDSADERVMPGYFKESLARKLPKGVWMHDWTQPIAKTLEARELDPGDPLLPEHLKALGGLYVKGAFNLETQRGREAYSDLKFGLVDEFSIGYRNTKTAYDEETGVRDLIEGDLYEWSPVLVGCNDQTALLGVKSLTFDQQFSTALDAVDSLLDRWEDLAVKRLETAPRLSNTHAQRMDALSERLSALREKAKAPDADSLRADLMRERLRFEKTRTGAFK
jgi:HK97 family phage prohead protease